MQKIIKGRTYLKVLRNLSVTNEENFMNVFEVVNRKIQ